MTFLEEVAQRIDKVLDGDCGYGTGEYLAEQLAPLIAEHDAKVRAEELREAADKFTRQAHTGWPHNVEVMEAAERFEAILHKKADRIEREAGE